MLAYQLAVSTAVLPTTETAQHTKETTKDSARKRQKIKTTQKT
jgi:hypothetical protein